MGSSDLQRGFTACGNALVQPSYTRVMKEVLKLTIQRITHTSHSHKGRECGRGAGVQGLERNGTRRLPLFVKCRYEEPRRQMHLLFHFHKHVDLAHPIYLLYHLLTLGTHSTQSKVKLSRGVLGVQLLCYTKLHE
jgi:hypothetical protein